MRSRCLCRLRVRSVSSASVSKLKPPARSIACLANRANGARQNCNAIPSRIGASIEIKADDILERLATSDKASQVTYFGMARYSADVGIDKWCQ